MKIVEQINNDIKIAMLSKEKEKLEALRAIKTALTIASSTKSKDQSIDDEEALTILQKLVKQRVESAEIYKKQDREDLANVELIQAKFIKVYLPQQLNEDEIEKIVNQIIIQNNANSIKDMGKVMQLAAKELQGRADNKLVSEIVKKLLN